MGEFNEYLREELPALLIAADVWHCPKCGREAEKPAARYIGRGRTGRWEIVCRPCWLSGEGAAAAL